MTRELRLMINYMNIEEMKITHRLIFLNLIMYFKVESTIQCLRDDVSNQDFLQLFIEQVREKDAQVREKDA